MTTHDWNWPEWLDHAWIAMDEDGAWVGHEFEPRIGNTTWGSDGYEFVFSADMVRRLQLPDVPWRESKRRNPHRRHAT